MPELVKDDAESEVDIDGEMLDVCSTDGPSAESKACFGPQERSNASSSSAFFAIEESEIETEVSLDGCVHQYMAGDVDALEYRAQDHKFEECRLPPVAAVDRISLSQLHLRMGCAIPQDELRRGLSVGAYSGVALQKTDNMSSENKCMSCALGDMRRGAMNPQKQSFRERMKTPVSINKWKEGVHGSADTFGPVKVRGYAGQAYIFCATANVPHTWPMAFPIKDKDSDTCDKCYGLVRAFYRRIGLEWLHLRTDNGSEFVGEKFQGLPPLGEDGTRVYDPVFTTRSAPGNQQQNGGVEGTWNSFLGPARKMLAGSGVAMKYWPFAVIYAAMCSRCGMVVDEDVTKHEVFMGVIPGLKKHRPFGILLVTKNLLPDHKLAPRGLMGIFLGICEGGIFVLFFITRQVGKARFEDTIFFENHFPFSKGSIKELARNMTLEWAREAKYGQELLCRFWTESKQCSIRIRPRCERACQDAWAKRRRSRNKTCRTKLKTVRWQVQNEQEGRCASASLRDRTVCIRL